MRYELSGTIAVWQHCYDKPHPIAGRPSQCRPKGACGGHWVEITHTEVVEAESPEHATELSMKMYSDLEPTWDEGYPTIKELPPVTNDHQTSKVPLIELRTYPGEHSCSGCGTVLSPLPILGFALRTGATTSQGLFYCKDCAEQVGLTLIRQWK